MGEGLQFHVHRRSDELSVQVQNRTCQRTD